MVTIPRWEIEGCALVRRWRFGSRKDGRALEVARRPGSVCCASRSKPDTLVASFDRFYSRGGKGAEENVWRVAGREHTYGQRQLKLPFPRLKMDLRHAQRPEGRVVTRQRYGQRRRRTRNLRQFVSIDRLQLNVPAGGLIEGKCGDLQVSCKACKDTTWGFSGRRGKNRPFWLDVEYILGQKAHEKMHESRSVWWGDRSHDAQR